MKLLSGGDHQAVSNVCKELKKKEIRIKYTFRHHFKGSNFETMESNKIPKKIMKRKLKLEHEQMSTVVVRVLMKAP